MLPQRISISAVQIPSPANVTRLTAYVYMLLHILVTLNTHAEVSVPDLDGAILTACCYQLPVAAVAAAGGHHLLPLKGPWLEHRFVLLL